MTLAQLFGANMRRVRSEAGLSLEALANDVGLSYSYVGEIERGRRNPTLAVVQRIADALGADPLDLLRKPKA